MDKLCFYIKTKCKQRYIWLPGVPANHTFVRLDDGAEARIISVVLTNVLNNRPSDSVGELELEIYHNDGTITYPYER